MSGTNTFYSSHRYFAVNFHKFFFLLFSVKLTIRLIERGCGNIRIKKFIIFLRIYHRACALFDCMGKMTDTPTKEPPQSNDILIEHAFVDKINHKLMKEKKYCFVVCPICCTLLWTRCDERHKRTRNHRSIEVNDRIKIGSNYKRLRMIVFPFQLNSKLFIVCRGYIFFSTIRPMNQNMIS